MSPRIVLFLAVLVPLLGRAQEWADAPSVEAPDARRASPPPLVSAPLEGVPAPASPAYVPTARLMDSEAQGGGTLGRVAFETLGAIAGGGVGGLLGISASAHIFDALNCRGPSFDGISARDCPDELAVDLGSIALGMSLGSSLGAWGLGSLMGGEGRFLPTLLGATVGSGVSMLAIFGMVSGDKNFLIPVALLAPILGPIIGYEVSHASNAPRLKPPAHAGHVQVVPVASYSAQGPRLGLAGFF